MASTAWSYSSIGLYKQCPHKYYRLKIVKDVVEPEGEHLKFGNKVHKACEEYVSVGKALPPDLAHFQPYLDKLLLIKGDKYCEMRLGLTKKLAPCDFFGKGVWWRGVIDLLIVSGDQAFIVDYKTGANSRHADLAQLELCALAVFKHFPKLQKIKAGLLFLCSNEFIKTHYEPAIQDTQWQPWIESAALLEKSVENNTWPKKHNFTCAKHCPVADCEMCGE